VHDWAHTTIGAERENASTGWASSAIASVREANADGALMDVAVEHCRLRGAAGERLAVANVVLVIDTRTRPATLVEGRLVGDGLDCVERAWLLDTTRDRAALDALSPPGPLAAGETWQIDAGAADRLVTRFVTGDGAHATPATGTLVGATERFGVSALELRWVIAFEAGRMVKRSNIEIQRLSGELSVTVVLPLDPALPALAMRQEFAARGSGVASFADGDRPLDREAGREVVYAYEPL
jgi:hypothetical protein